MSARHNGLKSQNAGPDPAPLLLAVLHLTVRYSSPDGPIRAVRDLSFEMQRGEVLALVGESGCGKSSVALALLDLLDGAEKSESCRILFEGEDLTALEVKGWRALRGRKIGMVFQDARSALNPVLTIGDHMIESLRAHQDFSRREARERAERLLTDVGIADAPFCMGRYPLELSGGMCQRVGIALAVCHQPHLLIADEPTSALDPTLQAQILDLLHQMSRRHGLALLLISHDLALVASYADRVAVMYHGRLVESGPARELFARPAHPYTRGLLESQPTLEHQRGTNPLSSIAGAPPAATMELPGCSFAPRCALAEPRCTAALPPAVALSENHWAACVKVGIGGPGPGAGIR
jgi:oligopeptide/dipeptide ABC transporter ATP-binding protein